MQVSFPCVYTWCMRERNVLISMKGQSKMSMGMRLNERTPTMSFALYNINVECIFNASYVLTWEYRYYKRCHEIFATKNKYFQKLNIPGTRFNSSGTLLFHIFSNSFHSQHASTTSINECAIVAVLHVCCHRKSSSCIPTSLVTWSFSYGYI